MVKLTGFLRADGNLAVLGIIRCRWSSTSASPIWTRASYGTGTVTVSISVLFFSASVSVTMTKTFGGRHSDFAQAISPADWDTYCEAFA